jgi:hypothetical protein
MTGEAWLISASIAANALALSFCQGGPMSDELKPQSIDSPEFRTLARDYAWSWKEDMRPEDDLAVLIAHIDAWGARLAVEAAKDAERYRWLRDKARSEWNNRLFVTDDGHKDYYSPNGLFENELDAAVDEAIAAAKKEPPCGS